MFDGDGPWSNKPAHLGQPVSNVANRSQLAQSFDDPFGGFARVTDGGTVDSRVDTISTYVKFCYAIPKFALVGAQTMAGAFIITRQYDDNDASEGDSAGYISVVAFIAVLAASVVQVGVAHFNDGMRTVYGRRRPLLMLLAPCCALGSFLLCHSWVHEASVTGVRVYYAITFSVLAIFLNTSETLLNALGTELTSLNNRDARLSLFAWQTGAGILGFFAASLGTDCL